MKRPNGEFLEWVFALSVSVVGIIQVAVYVVLIVATAASASLLSSCGPTYLSKCEEKAKAQGWDKTEVDLACGPFGDRFFFAKPTDSSNKKFEVFYSRLLMQEVSEQLDGFIKDIEELLDYKNENVTRYVERFGLREPLKKEVKILRFTSARVKLADLDTFFRVRMGQVSDYEPEETLYGYDAKKIFLTGDPRSAFPFTSDQIESARERGILQPIERLTLELDQKLAKREPDPAAPDDPNRFIWQPAAISFELTNYKIVNAEKPQDNFGNYIEGYRIVDGKKESHPALKVFFTSSGMAIVVIDSDKEKDSANFGLPDYVEEISGIIGVADVANSDFILSRLFEEKPEAKQKPPEKKKITVEIARIGEPVNVWTVCPEKIGCLVPFNYRNAREDNYGVRIKFGEDGHGGSSDKSLAKKVEYIAKEWTIGEVVEYFRPRPEFQNVLEADTSSPSYYNTMTKEVSFVLLDGSREGGIVAPGKSRFIEDEPYAVVYKEGQKRWWIEKSPGSKIFDKKKELPLFK